MYPVVAAKAVSPAAASPQPAAFSQPWDFSRGGSNASSMFCDSGRVFARRDAYWLLRRVSTRASSAYSRIPSGVCAAHSRSFRRAFAPCPSSKARDIRPSSSVADPKSRSKELSEIRQSRMMHSASFRRA